MAIESGVVELPRAAAAWEAVEYMTAKGAQAMKFPRLNLPLILVGWFRGVELFNQAEVEQIIATTPTLQVQEAHKRTLAMLIWQGEELMALLREHDITAQAGLTLADAEAVLEELYNRQRARYGGMTEARRSQVLDEVFGAAHC